MIAALKRLLSRAAPNIQTLPPRGHVARRIEKAIRRKGFSKNEATRATAGVMRELDEMGAKFDCTMVTEKLN